MFGIERLTRVFLTIDDTVCVAGLSRRLQLFSPADFLLYAHTRDTCIRPSGYLLRCAGVLCDNWTPLHRLQVHAS